MRIKRCLIFRLRQTLRPSLYNNQRPEAKTRFVHFLLNHSPRTRDHYHTLPKLRNSFRPINKLLVRNASNERKSFRQNDPLLLLPMKDLLVLVRLTPSLEKNRRRCTMLGKCSFFPIARYIPAPDEVCAV